MSRSRPRLVVHFQQFRGAGHRVRMARLAAALADHFEVCLLDGGPEAPAVPLPAGVRVVRLEPLFRAADGWIRPCRDGIALETALALRRRVAVATIERLRPAAFVVEFYPFARQILAPEIEAAVEATRAATPGALVVASVRDFLETGFEELPRLAADDPARLLARLRALDGLLVHADPADVLWDSRHPELARSAIPVTRTGYIGPRLTPPPAATARRGTLLSVGGGVDGLPLVLAVLDVWRRRAALALPAELAPLEVFLGPYLPPTAAARIAADGAALGVACHPYVADFANRLSRAALSISRGGYNTCADVLASGVRAIVSPTRVNDQLPRAERLAARGRVVVADDSAASIAAALQLVLAQPPHHPPPLLDGARHATEWIARRLQERGLL